MVFSRLQSSSSPTQQPGLGYCPTDRLLHIRQASAILFLAFAPDSTSAADRSFMVLLTFNVLVIKLPMFDRHSQELSACFEMAAFTQTVAKSTYRAYKC